MNGMSDERDWDEMTSHHDKNLNSTIIDPKYPYSQQAETVRQCLNEAFDEYASDIPLVNSFFLDLDFFMRHLKELQDYK
jgi:hypothetical protein